jgi:hypothetical protein
MQRVAQSSSCVVLCQLGPEEAKECVTAVHRSSAGGGGGKIGKQCQPFWLDANRRRCVGVADQLKAAECEKAWHFAERGSEAVLTAVC